MKGKRATHTILLSTTKGRISMPPVHVEIQFRCDAIPIRRLSQDKLNAMFSKLGKLGEELSNVRKSQLAMETFVRGLRHKKYLHPIHKPKNEKSKNVAMLFRDGIEIASRDKGEGQLKHLQFLNTFETSRYIRMLPDALRSLCIVTYRGRLATPLWKGFMKKIRGVVSLCCKKQ